MYTAQKSVCGDTSMSEATFRVVHCCRGVSRESGFIYQPLSPQVDLYGASHAAYTGKKERRDRAEVDEVDRSSPEVV